VVTLDAPRPGPAVHPAARFLRFCVVGATGVLVNLFLLLLLVDGAGLAPIWAAPLAIEASLLGNYLLNRAWTWRDRDRSWWSLLSYHGVCLLGALVQWVVLALGVHVLGLHYLLAGLVGVGAGTISNFLLSHHFSFVHYTPERRRRHLRVALYGLSLLVHVVLASLLAHDWDTFVFQKTVEELLQDGVTPYETGAAKPDYVYFGVGLPLQPMWYAYPPLPLLLMTASYAPAVLGLATAPWAGRLLIKLPFVLANLGLAFLAHRMLATAPTADPGTAARNARRVEAFLLFNPLFVMVATIWGMFESLLLCCLLLSVLALRSNRFATAGAWWGAATLIKIFPLYLGPLLLIHLWRTGGPRAAFRYFAAGGVLFGLVSLPFWLREPHGYVEQVFGMHANRPPGRFSPIALLYEWTLAASRSWPGTLPDDAGLVRAFSLLSFGLTVAVLGLLALASTRNPPTERALLHWAGLSFMGGLLVTKVVSEQYILLPLGLLALALWHPQTDPDVRALRLRRFLVWTPVFVCIAALLDNVHFLLFLPDDVAQWLLGRSVPDTILALANALGVTTGMLRAILGITGAIGLAVPFWLGVRLLAPARKRT
jgi:putative flippase GtrA